METLENALSILLDHVQPLQTTETVCLMDALGRIAGEDITSPISVPPFDRSPLDGYCMHSSDIATASRENPVMLHVIGEACAGCGERFTVRPGEALRLMTGAPIASGCDCVIRQEDTDLGMDDVAIYAPIRHGQNICYAGEDVQKGQVIVHRGEKLTSAHLGVLASVGLAHVTVTRPVKVALLCTGDELAQPGQPLSFGQIYDSSRTMLTLRLRELGAEVLTLSSQKDEPEAVAASLMEAASHADLLITTGGVSVGIKDIMHKVLPLMNAQQLFWRVAVKPGTPLLCGCIDQKLLICLSGNPFAALACFEVFAKPVIRKMSGSNEALSHREQVAFHGNFPKGGKVRRLLRARCENGAVTLTGDNHSSGSLSTMIGCNCLIDIPANSGPLTDGQLVEIIWL